MVSGPADGGLSTNYFMDTPNSELIRERMRLNKSAHQKPSTIKPVTISAANRTINALITKRKRPSVSNVIGMVKNINTGFTVRFNKANNAAITTPVKKSETEIPGKIKAVKITAKPATTIWAIIPKASFVLLMFYFVKIESQFKHFIFDNVKTGITSPETGMK